MSDRAPSVSVIVPTYNRAAGYLPVSLASIAAQTRPADEIIVVDDGSTDETATVVAAECRRARLIHQANQGRPAALNTGIRAASGDYLLLFDDDDALLPEALALHLEAIGADARADYTYSRYFVFTDASGHDDIWQRARWRPGDVEACEPERLLIATMEWIGAVLSSMLIARRCFDQVGLFSTELLRAQDYEFQVRLARCCRGRFLDCETFISRVHEGDRAAGHRRVKGADRHALSHQYEQHIFRGIRAELPLAEYLPRDPHASAPVSINAEQRAIALLTRSRIMFARGLFVEGAADIAAVLAEVEPEFTPFAELEALVRYAANIGQPDYQLLAARLARALCRACKRPSSRSLMQTAARSFYWTTLRALRRRNWRALPSITTALALVKLRDFQLALSR